MFVIERSQLVAAPAERTFAYFSGTRNLPAITPPWLRFTVPRPQDDRIFAGCEIDYTIRWLAVPLHWTTRITETLDTTRSSSDDLHIAQVCADERMDA